MRFRVSADSDWESGVGQFAIWLAKTNYAEQFLEADYGADLEAILIVLVCVDPALEYKRRIRYSRKDKAIYMDIMLRLSDFVSASIEERRRLALTALLKDVTEVLPRYAIDDFDSKSFLADFAAKFTHLLTECSVE